MRTNLKNLIEKLDINATAMVAEKVLGIGVNLVVFAVLARYLGPHLFGLFALVQAIFTIGFPVAMVVSEEIMLKFQVGQSHDFPSLKKQSLKLKLIASVVVYLLTALAGYLYFDKTTFYLITSFCLMHLVNFDLIYISYFRAIEKSHLVLKLKICVLIPFGLIKVLAAVYYPNLLLLLTCIFAAEALTLSVAARLLFKKHETTLNTGPSMVQTKLPDLLSACWPIFTAALLITLYTRIDQFMIEYYLSSEQLGLYSSASKLSQASQHILIAVLLARFPRLLKLRNQSNLHYEIAIISTLRACLLPWILIVVFLYFFSDTVISIIYGAEYVAADTTLILLNTATIFVYFGIVSTQWLIAENLQIYRLYRVFLGLMLNIFLNVLLIPKYGITGAAAATIISQACSSFLFNAAHPKTKPIFILQARSLWPAQKSNA